MKKFLLTLSIFFLVILTHGQNPLLRVWDYRYGGTSSEWITSFHQTSDGGYILGGWSTSDSSGDKTQPNWGPSNTPDFWIVKTDAFGIKQWDKRFGGNADDDLNSLQQTS